MKIVSFYNEEWEHEYIARFIPEHETIFLRGMLKDHPYLEGKDIGILCVFSGNILGKKELNRFPNLKAIVTFSTGFDHIDMEAAHKRNVVVSNIPTYGENTVAEYTFALLLSVSRRIYESYHNVLERGIFSAEGFRGFDLYGKTIGVVGTGHIGVNVIRIANGFGMNVVAYDVHPNNALAKQLGFKYVSFDELLGASSVISLHTPLNESTHHMINMDAIGKIRRGAYLINTSRGGLVDTSALIVALEQGVLAGAGLDVLEEEGFMADQLELLLSDHPNPESLRVLLANQYLIDHPRVIITPHNAFNTKEAMKRILNTAIVDIVAIAKGEPVNVVE